MQVVLAVLLAIAIPAHAADAKRNPAVRAEFQRQQPCPSTGATRGKCPGYQADHWTPRCIGGPDTVANLRWMTIEAHKAKTKSDVRLCRVHP